MATSSSLTFIPNASSQTAALDNFAHSSPTTAIHRRSAKSLPSTVYCRICKVVCQNSSGPDFLARAQKKQGGKSLKEPAVSKRSFRSLQPTVGITVDVQEDNQDKVTEQVVADGVLHEDSSDYGHGSTILEKAPVENDRLEDDKSVATTGSLSGQETRFHGKTLHEPDLDTGYSKITAKETAKIDISDSEEAIFKAVVDAGKSSTLEVDAVSKVSDAVEETFKVERLLPTVGSSNDRLEDDMSVATTGSLGGRETHFHGKTLHGPDLDTGDGKITAKETTDIDISDSQKAIFEAVVDAGESSTVEVDAVSKVSDAVEKTLEAQRSLPTEVGSSNDRLEDDKSVSTTGSLSRQETGSHGKTLHEPDLDTGDSKITAKETAEVHISDSEEAIFKAVVDAGKSSTVEVDAVSKVSDAVEETFKVQRPLPTEVGSSQNPLPTEKDTVTKASDVQGQVMVDEEDDTSYYEEKAVTAKASLPMERVVLPVKPTGIEVSMKDERSRQLKAELRRLQLRSLAGKNAVSGNKIFYYPEAAKAGSEIEIFLNRSITTLANQPKVLAMGAYNDWRWKPFVIELRKTDLPGDWWSCKLEIPDEVYKVDFVFFDGDKVYENNSDNDFFVLVEDGMQKEAFEEYLVEEKSKEAERIAAEKAEEERRAAEERRLAEAKVAEEADKAEARRQANEQRERSRRVLQKAVKSVDGLWKFKPSEFQGGETVKLFYNRSYRTLASSNEVWIHGGYNNWRDMVSIVGKLAFFSAKGGDWWTIDVDIPKHAFVINWVFADGPPERATIYDNNFYQDFHALVPKGVPHDLYWEEVEQQIYKWLQGERREREEAARRKVEHTALLKEGLKAKTMQIFRKSQAHIFYTDPADVQAGETVTIYYNPSYTTLNGKPEVWMRGSFNRWTHRKGCFLVKMLSAINNTHLKATVDIPLDAYMMDFVFSERGGDDGGVYDNRNGLDYHVPVVGGFVKEPPMHVVHISVEMAPIAKVGGLGDVVTSLSRAVQDLGHNVEVVLPKYDCLKYNHIQDLQEKEAFFWGGTRIRVWNGKVEGLSVHFLEPENGMFWVGCVYGRRDDGQRFGFFCNAALEFLLQSGRHPDIIHCHDWSSAPVTWLFQESYKHYGLSNARIVFTIHNMEFGTALIGKAMAHADKATTVSETYAKEVSHNSFIAPHLGKFHGIRNGIDLDIWDPYNDPFIPISYTSEQVVEGKSAAKQELQRRLGLAQVVDRPLVGVITRLTAQKGIHLIKHAISRTLERGGQVVLLGAAPDPRIQNEFNILANQLHNSTGGMARLCLHYDEPLSHLIYAGADFILIPSIFEPCGLTQLTAMRYGAIPVVRRTGGLNDTVFDVDNDRDRARAQGVEPNGFSFDGTDVGGVDYALNRALSGWYDGRHWFHGLCKQVMEQDWSWNRPALDYMELYYGARK